MVYSASVSGLRPGDHVSVALRPRWGMASRGVAVARVAVVGDNGRVSFRFRWPAIFHDCHGDGGRTCRTRLWRRHQQGVVVVDSANWHTPGSPSFGQPALRRVVRLHRGALKGRAATPKARSARAPLTSRCASPWMESAGAVGTGEGAEISFKPTQRARYLGRVLLAYDHIWNDLKHCLHAGFPAVSYDQEKSMYEQMLCHVYFGVGSLGGDTWDFEAWRPRVSFWTTVNVVGNSCNWDLGPDGGARYEDHIVQWSGDPKPHKTSWLVVRSGGRLVRHHIPTSRAFGCLKAAGKSGPTEVAASFFDRYLPDEFGTEVSESQVCGADSPGSSPPAPGGPPASAGAPPPPPPSTYREQQGSLGANTFTNPYNASGMGQKIAPFQWVDVSCKVFAPQIQSANPDGYWYRIASPPWNNAYYAVANTFWNGDVPGQKPYTHNTDFAVPNC
jgi:Protein of unknown function (DUF2599)